MEISEYQRKIRADNRTFHSSVANNQGKKRRATSID